jgi:hypothetical protein
MAATYNKDYNIINIATGDAAIPDDVPIEAVYLKTAGAQLQDKNGVPLTPAIVGAELWLPGFRRTSHGLKVVGAGGVAMVYLGMKM